MDDKVYSPEIIIESPFPGEPEPVALPGQTNPAGTFTATTNKEKTFPKKRTAVELLSTALNTRSRKILEKFDLEQRGAIQIGNFQEGLTGDLRLTPNGITARNIAGLTTFAIDGADGSATFQGTVRASEFISDSLITGLIDVGEGAGNSYVRLDGENNHIVVHDGTNPRIVIGNV